MNLKSATTTELEQELEKRKKTPEPVPQMLSEIGLEILKEMRGLAKEYVEKIACGEWYDEDNKEYLFEYSIELFYGKDIFERLRKYY